MRTQIIVTRNWRGEARIGGAAPAGHVVRAGRTAVLAVLAGLALIDSGCSQLFPPDSRQEANQRWSQVRARLKYQLARESFEAGHLEEAGKHLDESLSLNPVYAEAFVLQAKILLEKGETASASQALDEGLRHGADTAETDYLSGIICQRYRKFEDALAWYQRAAERDSASAPYVAAVAETLVTLDRTAEALRLVQARLTDFEQNATLRGLAGGIYMMLGEYEKAADAYRDAARISPDDARMRIQLGMALVLARKYEEARPVLVAASQKPDVEVSVLAALGECRLALDEPEEAKTVLRRAVEVEPSNSRHWVLLAQASIASHDLLTARRAALQATQLSPENRAYRLALGYVCWLQEDYRSAIPLLEPLTRGPRPDEVALYLLAESYRAAGSADQARACAEQALRADPSCQWARTWSTTRETPAAPRAGRAAP